MILQFQLPAMTHVEALRLDKVQRLGADRESGRQSGNCQNPSQKPYRYMAAGCIDIQRFRYLL